MVLVTPKSVDSDLNVCGGLQPAAHIFERPILYSRPTAMQYENFLIASFYVKRNILYRASIEFM
jgi:hypothetical protein